MTKNSTYSQGMEVQHEQIFNAVKSIETMARERFGEQRERILSEVEKLQFFLSRHFHWEENNEKFHKFIEERCPHRLLDLLTVFTDHQSLLESLDEIIGALKMGAESSEVRPKIDEFLGDLRAHEKLESEMTADILCAA